MLEWGAYHAGGCACCTRRGACHARMLEGLLAMLEVVLAMLEAVLAMLERELAMLEGVLARLAVQWCLPG